MPRGEYMVAVIEFETKIDVRFFLLEKLVRINAAVT